MDFLSIKNKAKNYLKKINSNDILNEELKQRKEIKKICDLLEIDLDKKSELCVKEKNQKQFIQPHDFFLKDDTINFDVEEIPSQDLYDEDLQSKKENLHDELLREYVPVSLFDVIKHFKNEGVIGEENLIIKIYLAASNNISFGVEGHSGSGKTFIVDKLIDLLNEKELYRLDLSSKMAVFYESKNINNYKTIYIPELQKALQDSNSPIVEVVKNLTEGKDVKRIVTTQTRKGNKTLKINKGKSIIYTLAAENYFKKDEELNRRFLRFKTNHEQEHLENILNQKAHRRQDFNFNKNDEEKKENIKKNLYYLRNDFKKIFDPYSTHISNYLPITQKSIGYVDHYFALVDATTKLNQDKRFKFNYQGTEYVTVDIEDHIIVHKIYYDEFLDTLLDFSEKNKLDEEITKINELRTKKIDWDTILKKGLQTVKETLKEQYSCFKEKTPLNFEDYAQEIQK